MNHGLTQEDRCELNNMRHEIRNMHGLTDKEKCDALSDLLRSVLEYYTPESTMAVARHRICICREVNDGRKV